MKTKHRWILRGVALACGLLGGLLTYENKHPVDFVAYGIGILLLWASVQGTLHEWW